MSTTTTIEVKPGIKGLFVQEFYAERSNFADVPSDKIRGAGRPTKANPNGEDELWWLAHGPEMLQRWEDWREQSGWQIWVTPEGVPAIELDVEVTYNDQLLKAYIDRVFVTESGALVILDLKSGARTPASDLQLGFYAAVVKIKYGVEIAGGTYWMAREGTCEPVEALVRWTPRLLAHYAHQLQVARREGIYLPNVTSMCRACGVRDYCLAVNGSKSHLDPDYQFVSEEGEENDCNS